MAEVIKVVGTQVYVQVFESTRGLKVGALSLIHIYLLSGVTSRLDRWFLT